MSNSYAIVFKGEALEGADLATVKQKIGAMFKANDAKLAALFSGKPVAIKKNVDEATANKFVAAFAKAGAKAYVKNLAESEPKTEAKAVPQAAPAVAAATNANSSEKVEINPASAASVREAPQTVVNIQPQGDTNELSMREQGGFLVEPQAADNTPPPEALEADLAAEGTTIPAPARDTTPAPEPGNWSLSDGAGPSGGSGGKASFSLDP